ncbi:hypothetical protein ACH5RR_015738 [Cinchona calisaya]|uniref:Uncharacterized protein n=1 Tax=Cinchona calisaya TaxID=153742 RepID=A0ABD2ZUW6_9GENT
MFAYNGLLLLSVFLFVYFFKVMYRIPLSVSRIGEYHKSSNYSSRGKVKGQKINRLIFMASSLGDANRLISVMNAEFPELGLKKSDCWQMSWIETMLWWYNFKIGTAKEALLRRTLDSVIFLKTPIPKYALESLYKKMVHLSKTGLVFSPYGGRMSKIPENETPFPHRSGIIFKIQYLVNWEDEDPNLITEYVGEARDLYSFMTPFWSKKSKAGFSQL